MINTFRLKKNPKKHYNEKVYANFQHKTVKHNKCFAGLLVIILDSTFVNSDKEYYPQVFLEKSKYLI